jgi:hypothetical protein
VTRREIERRGVGKHPVWLGATQQCRDAFIRAMKPYDLGLAGVQNAMRWFVAGWEAAGE